MLKNFTLNVSAYELNVRDIYSKKAKKNGKLVLVREKRALCSLDSGPIISCMEIIVDQYYLMSHFVGNMPAGSRLKLNDTDNN